MRTPERMTCDVCGCDTGHLTIGKDGKPDECQRCYWSRTLDVATLTAERDSLVRQRTELEKAWDGADRDADKLAAKCNRLEDDVERLTKDVEHADGEADRFASKCIRLQDDNARHLETIRALRSTLKSVSNDDHGCALDPDLECAECIIANALDASKGYEQADDVKGGG